MPHQLEEPVVGGRADDDVNVDDVVHDLKGVAVLGDPIVCTAVVTVDERGQGALAATPRPSPKEHTPAAKETHKQTHVPVENWCASNVASRRPHAHQPQTT